MTVIFFGSSEFSIAALKACLDFPLRILKVITTPDRKKGRGLKEMPTPVRIFAEERKLPVAAPENLKSGELIQEIQNLKPELFVVSSYGKIIPSAWLKIPSRYSLNVHPSLLPKHRGAAPVNWPILNGEKETGLSIADITNRLDAGDLFYQKKISIEPQDDSQILTSKLAALSCDALKSLFEKIKNGETLNRTPQNEAQSSYARKLSKEDGQIQWTKSAEEIWNQSRGLVPWPSASFVFQNETVQILKSRVESAEAKSIPGKIIKIQKEGPVFIQTGNGILALETLKPSGKKEMSAAEFIRGRRLAEGSMLGENR